MCFLLLIFLLEASFYSHGFTIPEALLQTLSPKGLKISIADIDPDVTLVAFHVNVNEEFTGVEAGHWAKDVLRRKNGYWTAVFPDVRVQNGDVIHYWVYAIRNGLGYQNLFRNFTVISGGLPPTTETMSTTVRGNEDGTTWKPRYTTPKYSMAPENNPVVSLENPENYSEATVHLSEDNPHPLVEVSSSVPVDWRNCELSTTTIRQGGHEQVPCSGRVIFNADFHSCTGLDQWKHEVYIGGKELDDAFTIFVKDDATSKVRDGNLFIKPVLLEDMYSKHFVTNGNLTLHGCTADDKEFCSTQAMTFMVLPPIVSARLTTKDSFRFRYGVVEIKAKLPKGDWIVPELRLEPKTPLYGNKSGQIVMALSRGNSDLKVEGRTISTKLLEAGLVIDSSKNVTFQKTTSRSWADGFHKFKLIWSPEALEFLVDDQQIGRLAKGSLLDPSLDGDKLLPFDKEFYISVGLHVGGLQDFPDTAMSRGQLKPWRNSEVKARLKFWQAKDAWYPSWNANSVLVLDSVKVTAL